MKKLFIVPSLLLLASFGAPAQVKEEIKEPGQQAQQTLRTRSLAATCAQCHGTAGRAVPGSAVPGLAGLPAPYLVEQMKAFKSGSRSATVMHQIAKGYSDAQVERLAAHFSVQKTEGAR